MAKAGISTMLDIISPAISMEADMIFIFVMALVTGMAMFQLPATGSRAFVI